MNEMYIIIKKHIYAIYVVNNSERRIYVEYI